MRTEARRPEVRDKKARLAQLGRLVTALLELDQRVCLRVLHVLSGVTAVVQLPRCVVQRPHLHDWHLSLAHLPWRVPERVQLGRREARVLFELPGGEEARLELHSREGQIKQLLCAKAHCAKHLSAYDHLEVRAACHALGDELRNARLPRGAFGLQSTSWPLRVGDDLRDGVV